MSQFIEGIAAPTFGDFGDGGKIGAALFGDESSSDFYIPSLSAQINNWSLSCDSVVNVETKFQSTATFWNLPHT